MRKNEENKLTLVFLNKGKEVKRWNVLTNGHTSIRVEARDSHIRHMACSNLYGRRGCYIYVATGRNVTVIEEASGRLIHTLRGHPDPINHLVFNSHENELYSACRQLIAAWGNYPVSVAVFVVALFLKTPWENS